MELQQEIFAVKLCALEEEYGRLQSRLRVFEQKDAARIRAALDELRDECREQDMLLEQRAKGSRTPAVEQLAQAQLAWQRRAEALLPALEKDMGDGSPAPARDRAEAAAVYAEFAIDFATQSMRHALLAALQALEQQTRADEAGAGN